MSDNEDVESANKTKPDSTSARQGTSAPTETNLPRQGRSGTGTSEQPLLAEHGGTTLVDPELGMGLVLPFESEVQGHIGRQLRAVYDEVLHQPIPDRFLELLSRLDDIVPEELPSSPTAANDWKGDE